MYRSFCKKNVLLVVGLAIALLIVSESYKFTVFSSWRVGSQAGSKNGDVLKVKRMWSNGLDADVKDMEQEPSEDALQAGQKLDEAFESNPNQENLSYDEDLKALKKMLDETEKAGDDVDEADNMADADEAKPATHSSDKHAKPKAEETKKDDDDAVRRELENLEKMLKDDEPEPEVEKTPKIQPPVQPPNSSAKQNKSDSKLIRKSDSQNTKAKVANAQSSSLKNIDGKPRVNTPRPVVNFYQVRYLINTPDACKSGKLFLLCYVHSAPKNFLRRQRIRLTWGNRTNYPGADIRFVFFTGKLGMNSDEDRKVQKSLDAEVKTHGDIIQGDFIDSRANKTYKELVAFRWVSTYCKTATYVLKTDDDMFVNMFVILNHLRLLSEANRGKRLMMCYVYRGLPIPESDVVARNYFKATTVYPPFCSGMGIVFSSEVVVALDAVAPYVPLLPQPDPFLSGVLPRALNGAVNLTSWYWVYCGEHEMGVYTHKTEWYKYAFTHSHDEVLNVKTWKGLAKIARNRTIPKASVVRPGLVADSYIPLDELFPRA